MEAAQEIWTWQGFLALLGMTAYVHTGWAFHMAAHTPTGPAFHMTADTPTGPVHMTAHLEPIAGRKGRQSSKTELRPGSAALGTLGSGGGGGSEVLPAKGLEFGDVAVFVLDGDFVALGDVADEGEGDFFEFGGEAAAGGDGE